MKRLVVSFLILFMFAFVNPINIKADSFTMSGCPSSLTKGKEFTITIYGSYSGGNIDVRIDSSGDITKTSGQNNTFTLTENSKTKYITYRADKTGGTATITATITNGVSGLPATRTCKISAPSSTTTKKQENKSTTTKTTTTTQAKSNNANLKSLTIKDQDGAVLKYTPEFKSDTYDYTIEAESSVTKVSIEPSLEHEKANYVIGDNINEELTPGETTKIVVTITAEDGISKKAYNINVNRAALKADATLKSLTISELSTFKLEKNVYEYDLLIDNNFTELTIKAEPNDENATISIIGNEKLKEGSKIKILVTAQDKNTTKEYVLNISKIKETTTAKVTNDSGKDPLVIIILSVVALSLITSIFYTIKK